MSVARPPIMSERGGEACAGLHNEGLTGRTGGELMASLLFVASLLLVACCCRELIPCVKLEPEVAVKGEFT